MKPFDYARPGSVEEALTLLDRPGARLVGGGTNLVDLMREGVEEPASLIDVAGLGLDEISRTDDGYLIGAGVRNADLAAHPELRRDLPVLAEALVSGASGQIRNLATVGGNLLQRTRCSYFYDGSAACNKRSPGAGCDARGGHHRGAAVLGTSDSCIAAHPSDLCVALAALDGVVHLRSAAGARQVPLADFHLEPGDTPHRETVLEQGEIVTAVEVPLLPDGARSTYRKVRDRASYAFALVSVAAVLRVEDGVAVDLRLALGGVGTKPWRARIAEDRLRGRAPDDDAVREAVHAEMTSAVTGTDNAFKVGLAERTAVAVLRGLRRDAGEGSDR